MGEPPTTEPRIVDNVRKDNMEARKLKTVTKEMTQVEKELEGLRTELPKARSRMVDIRFKREKIVYRAKTGDSKAQAKLEELNKQLGAAKVEQDDLETAIRQGGTKLETLGVELTEAKQQTGRDLIRQFSKSQEKEMLRIDAAMGEIVEAVKTSKKGLDDLRQELSNLDFRELNLESKFRRVTVAFITSTLYGLFPRDFDRSSHKHFRNRPLIDMAKDAFAGVADSPKDLLEDPDESVIQVDPCEVRRVPPEEVQQQLAQRAQMKQQAAEMRKEGVPA
jgi:predicted  nucleic acid-binding Zn-ribbon protein